MKILFFQYPSCSTCKKAAKWLKDHDIDIESKHIVETPPTVGELTEWITRSNLPLQKFFNTSGQKYRELNLKNRISTIPEKELIELLASDGKLIKRPLLVTDSQVLVGFNGKMFCYPRLNDLILKKNLGARLFARFKKKYYLCAANANNNQLKNFKWQQKSDYNALVTKTTHFTKL